MLEGVEPPLRRLPDHDVLSTRDALRGPSIRPTPGDVGALWRAHVHPGDAGVLDIYDGERFNESAGLLCELHGPRLCNYRFHNVSLVRRVRFSLFIWILCLRAVGGDVVQLANKEGQFQAQTNRSLRQICDAIRRRRLRRVFDGQGGGDFEGPTAQLSECSPATGRVPVGPAAVVSGRQLVLHVREHQQDRLRRLAAEVLCRASGRYHRHLILRVLGRRGLAEADAGNGAGRGRLQRQRLLAEVQPETHRRHRLPKLPGAQRFP
mmetsp:Transcript_64988/g.116877  ORF Transcript_64988/g.116877 Transcript_64988/m.116877 type:complete len:264 (+) Transcript_64988:389-1180(+)